MKRLTKLLQFSVLAVGAVALGVSLNAVTPGKVKSQGEASPSMFSPISADADAPRSEIFALVGGESQTVTQPTHVINVTLTSPDDLKVKEGELVEKGGVISVRRRRSLRETALWNGRDLRVRSSSWRWRSPKALASRDRTNEFTSY